MYCNSIDNLASWRERPILFHEFNSAQCINSQWIVPNPHFSMRLNSLKFLSKYCTTFILHFKICSSNFWRSWTHIYWEQVAAWNVFWFYWIAYAVWCFLIANHVWFSAYTITEPDRYGVWIFRDPLRNICHKVIALKACHNMQKDSYQTLSFIYVCCVVWWASQQGFLQRI